MTVLEKIAFFQNRRDEVPNQELAGELAASRDSRGIQEIAKNLHNPEQNIQSDCLKVLYEVGYIHPELITAYTDEFIHLLAGKNNRMVWGSMIALACVAGLEAEKVYQHRETIRKTMEKGSLITVDNGVKILATLAAQNEAYRRELLPYLFKQLETCIPRDVARYAGVIQAAITPTEREAFVQLLEKRLGEMSPSQAARTRKVVRAAMQRKEV